MVHNPLSKMGEHIMDDLEKETVDMSPNFDDSLMEPTVMPTKVPKLLVNGGNGIAVGMATNIPTHNLGEVIDGCCAFIDNPDIDTEELRRCMQTTKYFVLFIWKSQDNFVPLQMNHYQHF